MNTWMIGAIGLLPVVIIINFMGNNNHITGPIVILQFFCMIMQIRKTRKRY